MKILSKIYPVAAVLVEVMLVYELGKEVYGDIKKYRRAKNIKNQTTEAEEEPVPQMNAEI